MTTSLPLTPRHDYIDAVRGWAFLLVMTCHVGAAFSAMPYPVRKLTNFGWHGVQLFFLASAVTLLMSWHRRPERGWPAVRSFFLRRFLRIAPMYYSGAAIYFLADPPASGFDVRQALRFFAFVNVWTPDWTSTTTAGWTVIPGGWSVGVEFTFYFLFPALVALIVTLRGAMILLAATLVLGGISNYLAAGWLSGYSATAANNFLYFWFPNQAPVFAMGFVLYFLVSGSVRIISAKAAYPLLCATAASCMLIAECPTTSNRFGIAGVPTVFWATLAFVVFIYVLARAPETLFTHRHIRRLGTLSFSAYVLHFLFVYRIPGWTHGWIDLRAVGYTAIAGGAALWVLTFIGTVAAATITHRLIERPGMAMARSLTRNDGRPDANAGAAGAPVTPNRMGLGESLP